jgi:hypothetical protein
LLETVLIRPSDVRFLVRRARLTIDRLRGGGAVVAEDEADEATQVVMDERELGDRP